MTRMMADLSKVNRVEVIDSQSWRVYTNYGVEELEWMLQDEDRTLKIFVTTK